MSQQGPFVIRFAHQCGVGLDPNLSLPNRKDRPKQYRYYYAVDLWWGGPKTANRYETLKEAKEKVAKYGHTEAFGSIWLGHCWPCEIVPADYAMATDL